MNLDYFNMKTHLTIQKKVQHGEKKKKKPQKPTGFAEITHLA